jgi:mannose/fructose/N-acetylgalactosamine-specific phosphotransferase system component IIB
MPIVQVRVDDRLIHGQITTMWMGLTAARRIIISSDEVANDPLQRTIVNVTKPPQVPTDIMANAQTIAAAKSGAWDHDRILIICKYVTDALALVKAGIGITEINIGNVGGMLEDHKLSNRKRVSQSVMLTPDEVNVLREIQAAGVKMDIRLTPRDKLEDVAAILAKLP